MESIKNLIADEGYRAAAEGKKLTDNPWSARDAHENHFAWRKGWLEYAAECI